MDTFGSSFDTLLAVYTGGSVSNLTLVASGDDYGQLLTSLVTFVATAGTTYDIAVDGLNGDTGTVVLAVSLSPPGSPSINTPLQSQTADVGGSVTFAVTATGPGHLSYLWFRNGLAISGATQALFTMDNLSANDSALYSVVVSNP